jgi:hypothetical protein
MARAVTANFGCLVRGELDSLEHPVPELGVLPVEGFILLDQFRWGGSAAVLGLHGGQDLPGMIGDALAAAAGLMGPLGDGTLVPADATESPGSPCS